MAWTRIVAALGCCAVLAGCAPMEQGEPAVVDDGFAAPPADSGSTYTGPPDMPASDSPVATTGEIQDYLYNGSVEVAWYGDGETLYQVECGFIDGGGNYEAEAFGTEPDGTYSYDWWYSANGAWFASDAQLCANITYYDDVTGEEWPTSGCYLPEWSTDDSLLLIDGRDQVAAEIFAWDGRQHYAEGCGM